MDKTTFINNINVAFLLFTSVEILKKKEEFDIIFT